MTIHPLLEVQRSANGELESVAYARGGGSHRTESFIHFEIVRETDAQRHAAVEAAVAATLRDVRAAVEDWPVMLDRLRAAAADLQATQRLDEDLKAESGAFLEWLALDNFTLLGYREYDLVEGKDFDELVPKPKTGLGLLRGERGESRRERRGQHEQRRDPHP